MPYNLAAEKFGTLGATTDSLVSDRAPYLKYTWVASFEFDQKEGSGTGEPAGGETAADISNIVLKTFELPRWSTDTQIVNVYNHKTVVQTKLNFEPITISFYDQQNQAAESLIWEFVKGQFDPNNASKKAEIKPLKVTVKMHTTSAGGLDASQDKTYVLGKAYIIDAQHDTLDYATSDVVIWTITLRYETLEWPGGFEGEPPTVTAGIAKKDPPPKTPKPQQTPPPYVEPIPDAAPSMMDMMDGNMGGDVNYGAVNHNPVGLSKVLDQQRSREKVKKEQPAPGADVEPTYTGYESAFVPTPMAPSASSTPSARSTSPSTGATGSPAAGTSPTVDRPTATSNSTNKVQRQDSRTTVTQERTVMDPGGAAGAQARNNARRQIQDHQDQIKAKQTGQTVEQVRAARQRNMRELDQKTKDKDF